MRVSVFTFTSALFFALLIHLWTLPKLETTSFGREARAGLSELAFSQGNRFGPKFSD